MLCQVCNIKMVKFGTDRKGQQRYRCACCGKTKTDSSIKHFTQEYQEQVDKMLKEKISIRAIGRILGFHHTLILQYIRKKENSSATDTKTISVSC